MKERIHKPSEPTSGKQPQQKHNPFAPRPFKINTQSQPNSSQSQSPETEVQEEQIKNFSNEHLPKISVYAPRVTPPPPLQAKLDNVESEVNPEEEQLQDRNNNLPKISVYAPGREPPPPPTSPSLQARLILAEIPPEQTYYLNRYKELTGNGNPEVIAEIAYLYHRKITEEKRAEISVELERIYGDITPTENNKLLADAITVTLLARAFPEVEEYRGLIAQRKGFNQFSETIAPGNQVVAEDRVINYQQYFQELIAKISNNPELGQQTIEEFKTRAIERFNELEKLKSNTVSPQTILYGLLMKAFREAQTVVGGLEYREQLDAKFNKLPPKAQSGTASQESVSTRALSIYQAITQKDNPTNPQEQQFLVSLRNAILLQWFGGSVLPTQVQCRDGASCSNLGYQAHNRQAYQEAFDYYQRAIELEPDYATAWNGRGVAYSYLGDSEQALKNYEQGIALDAGRSIFWTNKGLILIELGRYKEAITALDQAITLNQHWGDTNLSKVEQDRVTVLQLAFGESTPDNINEDARDLYEALDGPGTKKQTVIRVLNHPLLSLRIF